MTEKIKISGQFHCQIHQNGKCIRSYSDENLIVNNGIDKIATSLISGTFPGITHVKVGEGVAAPAGTDTNLSGATFLKAITSSSVVANVTTINWFIALSEANGIVITEFGLMLADSTLFARKTGLTVNKNGTITLTGQWVITITP